MVAIPCGHLTCCFPCMKYYVEQCNNKCLVCKREMKEAFDIERNVSSNGVKIRAKYRVDFE
jgi:hypothetical protein